MDAGDVTEYAGWTLTARRKMQSGQWQGDGMMDTVTTVMAGKGPSEKRPAKTRVYTASAECLTDPERYQKAWELLPAQRRESADRMKIESGKRLSAGAGLLLMAALADYLYEGQYSERAGTAEAWRGEILKLRPLRFDAGEKGKPYLPEQRAVHFNLSHSGSRVMCVVSDREVGCDVEAIEQRRVSQVIRCLAESEQAAASESAENFFRIWTLKESILKLSGEGLAIPLRSFEVSLDPLKVRQSFIPGQVILKEYREFRDSASIGTASCGGNEKRYCCSCAIEGGALPERMTQVDLSRIIG